MYIYKYISRKNVYLSICLHFFLFIYCSIYIYTHICNYMHLKKIYVYIYIPIQIQIHMYVDTVHVFIIRQIHVRHITTDIVPFRAPSSPHVPSFSCETAMNLPKVATSALATGELQARAPVTTVGWAITENHQVKLDGCWVWCLIHAIFLYPRVN